MGQAAVLKIASAALRQPRLATTPGDPTVVRIPAYSDFKLPDIWEQAGLN